MDQCFIKFNYRCRQLTLDGVVDTDVEFVSYDGQNARETIP